MPLSNENDLALRLGVADLVASKLVNLVLK